MDHEAAGRLNIAADIAGPDGFTTTKQGAPPHQPKKRPQNPLVRPKYRVKQLPNNLYASDRKRFFKFCRQEDDFQSKGHVLFG